MKLDCGEILRSLVAFPTVSRDSNLPLVVLLVLVLPVMGQMGLVEVDHPGIAAFMWPGSLGC